MSRPSLRPVTAELRKRLLAALITQWPEPLATMTLIERAGGAPSTTRRELAALRDSGTVEKTDAGWRSCRPTSAASICPRPGVPLRRVGFRELWLAHRAREEAINHG